MAIYQPSNVIPSSFGGVGSGTIASADKVNVSWQINGNSALQAYQIDVYKNTALSELVFSTGIIDDGCPAYGTDSKGNPISFSYTPDTMWSNWGLSDGNNYKIGITQLYSSITAETLSYTLTAQLSANTSYYLNYQYQNYLVFTADEDNYTDLTAGTIIYYNITVGKGWYFKNNTIRVLSIAFTDVYPSAPTYLGDAQEISSDDIFYKVDFAPQFSDSAIIARSTPSLSLNTVASISTVEYTFIANYSQAQNDGLNWVQWRLNLINEEGDYILIDDTGKINTSILSYTYNGFLSNYTYEIVCNIETENGIQVESISQFAVKYDEASISNQISIGCDNNDGSILISWEKPTQTNIDSVAVYRRNSNQTLLQHIGNVTANINQIKDYGVVNFEKYSYVIFFINNEDKYSAPIESSTICKQYQYYTLIEATADSENPNVFHTLQTFKFGNNLISGSITNNNTPNWLTNFSKYRLKQPSTLMGKSGILQALLNNVDKDTNIYEDSAKMMEKLFALSKSLNTFFLKDMKGNLYMISISNPIEETINIKSSRQEVSVSIPWEEIGDASNVSVIQTPLDEGWGNVANNMVLETTMNVNPYSGELSVSYPPAYVGTRFNMSNEYLTATTPNILQQPVFYLSNDDGSLQVTLEE